MNNSSVLLVALARTISPALVGGLLGQWTMWVWLPIAPALLIVFAAQRPYTGFGVAIVLEMIVLRAHGLAAFLFLLALWLAWQPIAGRGKTALYPIGAAAALLSAGWLTGQAVAWAGAAGIVCALFVCEFRAVLASLLNKRRRRRGR